MSYEPNRENKSMFMSAWCSYSQPIRNVKYSNWPNYQTYSDTLELNLVGEGDAVIESYALTPPNNLYGYYVGDIRINTDDYPQAHGDQFCIQFEENDGATSAGGQTQRYNRCDDQCYAIANSAKIIQTATFRSSGDTIAPFVRVLGVLIEEE